jgi:peptidyl-prolyl cis-trans isomerase C
MHLEPSRRNELILNWVESELLYKEAVNQGLEKDKNYIASIEDTKRALAKAYLINKIVEDARISVTDKELEDYYNLNKSDFHIGLDAYNYNFIIFNDERKAILFRNTLGESDWNRSLNVFRGDSSIIADGSNIFHYEYQIYPLTAQRAVKYLYPGEISIVLKYEPDQYAVFQLIQKYEKGTTPEFSAIKDEVKERYLMMQKNTLIKNYIKNLYSKYDVEINLRN